MKIINDYLFDFIYKESLDGATRRTGAVNKKSEDDKNLPMIRWLRTKYLRILSKNMLKL